MTSFIQRGSIVEVMKIVALLQRIEEVQDVGILDGIGKE